MRILHVTPYFEHAWAYGGIPRAAAATVRALARRGHEVTVCTTDACGPDTRLGTHPRPPGADRGVHVHVFPNLSNRVAYHLQFFMPRGMNRYLATHAADFDVAHLHGCHHVPGAFAARHLRRAGVPYVVTTHGTAPYIERRRTAKRVFDATLGRGMLEGAARVIAVSEAEREDLHDLGVPSGATCVIPNPIELSEFGRTIRGEFRRRVGLDAGTPVVMFLGKFTPRKRLDVLVRAFAALDRPDARLVIAGNDMGYGPALRADLARAGVAGRTLMPGLLTGDERLAALTDADVVAYASELEVFGLVPVEALLCGTPVVVANDSGCGSVVGQVGGGLVVPPGNAVALRDALARVLDDPDRWRQRAQDAGLRARWYDSREVGIAIERVYQDAAAAASLQPEPLVV